MISDKPLLVSPLLEDFKSEYLQKCEASQVKPFSIVSVQSAPSDAETICLDDSTNGTYISVRSFTLTLPHLTILSSVIVTNFTKQISKLNLWRCKISDQGIKLVAGMLKECPIEHLQIEDNPLESDITFAELIVPSIKLQFLSLRSNRIHDSGAKLLFQRLETNVTITVLNLWNNHVGDEGAKALAECLKTNRTLIAVSLSKNLISDTGAVEISKSLTKFEITQAEQDKMVAIEQRRDEERKKSTADLTALQKSPSKRNLDKDGATKKSNQKISTKQPDKPTTAPKKTEPVKKEKQTTLSVTASKPASVKAPKQVEENALPSFVFEEKGIRYSYGNKILIHLNLSQNTLTNNIVQAAFAKVSLERQNDHFKLLLS